MPQEDRGGHPRRFRMADYKRRRRPRAADDPDPFPVHGNGRPIEPRIPYLHRHECPGFCPVARGSPGQAASRPASPSVSPGAAGRRLDHGLPLSLQPELAAHAAVQRLCGLGVPRLPRRRLRPAQRHHLQPRPDHDGDIELHPERLGQRSSGGAVLRERGLCLTLWPMPVCHSLRRRRESETECFLCSACSYSILA